MLTSAHIRNFRSCKDVKLDNLGHMVALVGRNGAGKTTILRALEWVASTALLDNATPELLRVSFNDKSSVIITFTTKESHFRLDVGHNAKNSPQMRESLSVHTLDGSWQNLFTRVGEQVTFHDRRPPLNLHKWAAVMPMLASSLRRSDPLRPHLDAAMDALQRISYYPGQFALSPSDPVTIEPSGPVPEADYAQWAASPNYGQRRSSIIFRLISAHTTSPEILVELEQLLGPGNLDLLANINIITIGDIEPSKSGSFRPHRYFDVRFLPTRSKAEVSLNQLSGGTRHTLYLLLGLLYDDCSTLLIEQPEDGIHPGLLAKLIDVLRVNTDPAQVFLASHSPVVLSNLRPSEIRLVDIQDGSTTVRPLSPAEIQRAQEYMQRDGTLAEFLELIQED